MKKWLLLCSFLLLLAGCSMLEVEPSEQDEIPKSYSLAIGYANEAEWDKATVQFLETIETEQKDTTFYNASLLLLVHFTNAELVAMQEIGDDAGYKALVEASTATYEQLLKLDAAVGNDVFLGLNYNLSAPELVDVSADETLRYELVSEHILTYWSVIFNESPIDMKLLLEQSSSTIEAADPALSAQLAEKVD